jgi:nitrite reductase/ring-hydroxylating ferredoxin subunit
VETYEIDDEALEAARRELNREEPEGPTLFELACLLSDIPSDKGKLIVRESDEIALFRLNGSVYAISNICPHEMSPLIAAGAVNVGAQTVTCPLHGWIFSIPTGKQVGASGGIPIYAVKIEGEEVWVSEWRKDNGTDSALSQEIASSSLPGSSQ